MPEVIAALVEELIEFLVRVHVLISRFKDLWIISDLAKELIGDLAEAVDIRGKAMCVTGFYLRCKVAVHLRLLLDRCLSILKIEEDSMLKAVYLENDSLRLVDPHRYFLQAQVPMDDPSLV